MGRTGRRRLPRGTRGRVRAIGIFVIKAAVDYNPKDAIGLHGALQKLAQASYGPYLLGLTARVFSATASTASSTLAIATSRRTAARE